jgi:hypothetical protein
METPEKELIELIYKWLHIGAPTELAYQEARDYLVRHMRTELTHLSDNLSLKTTTNADNGSRDVWLCFKSSTGKSAMLSVAALAERHDSGIIKVALLDWARDRVDEFGVGA